MAEDSRILSTYHSALRLLQLLESVQVHSKYKLLAVDMEQIHCFRDKIHAWIELLEGLTATDLTPGIKALLQRFSHCAFNWSNMIDYHVVDQKCGVYGVEFGGAVHTFYGELAVLIDELMRIRGESSNFLRSTKEEVVHLSCKKTKEAANLVGIERPLQRIKDKLTSHVKDRQVIAIVGMGGSGKTALAGTVYDDFSVTRKHFDECYWITISQEYDVLKIIQKMLDDNNTQEVRDLGTILYQKLFDHRYLIVLDDLWSIKAWEELVVYFPNRNNGSRIIVTTRELSVAKSLSPVLIHQIDLLDGEASWELLSKKVPCADELQGIGKEIARNCKGLPLSIIMISGLLSKSDMSLQSWRNVADAVTSFVSLEDDERCMKTLYLSYDNLPLHLKLCFLSFSYYAEDQIIDVDDLIRSWIVEAMIRPEKSRGMEEIALDYLKDLIERNMVFSRKYNDFRGIKHIRIHDLLLDLCRKESSIENVCMAAGMDRFFHRKKKSSVNIPAMRCVDCSTTYFMGFCGIVLVSSSSTKPCYGRIFHKIHSILIDDYVYTQLCLECNKVVAMELFIYGVLLHPIFSVSIISECKEIKVPHFHGMNKDIIPFESLEHYHFPENLLWNVQQYFGYEKRSCKMMPQLKFLDSMPNQDEEDIVLEQLIGIDFRFGVFPRPSLPKLIKRLGICGVCIINGARFGFRMMPQLKFLDYLPNRDEDIVLEQLIGTVSLKYVSDEPFLSKSIKRLGIFCNYFSELIQSVIRGMPNLEHLALRFCYHIGTTIVGSHSLRYLGISLDDDAKGRLEIDCPRLERLWLHGVGRLRSFLLRDDSSLQSIRLEGCGESTVQWAMEILEKKRSLGDNNFYVEMDGRMQFDWSKRVWKICRPSMLFFREGLEDEELPLLEMMICTQLYDMERGNYNDVIKYLSGFHKDRQRENFFLFDRSMIYSRKRPPKPKWCSNAVVRFPNLKVIRMRAAWDGSPLSSLLKKLNLCGTLIDEAKTRIIMELHNLEVLELWDCTFENEEWCNPSQGNFIKLKELGIDDPVGLKSLKVEEEQFPQLLTLQIWGWEDDICDITCNITTLSSIRLRNCGASTIRSAKKILRERRYDWGDEDFYVVVDGRLLTKRKKKKRRSVTFLK